MEDCWVDSVTAELISATVLYYSAIILVSTLFNCVVRMSHSLLTFHSDS